jgi:hypothetical protein
LPLIEVSTLDIDLSRELFCTPHQVDDGLERKWRSGGMSMAGRGVRLYGTRYTAQDGLGIIRALSGWSDDFDMS